MYIHIPFCFHKCHYCDFYSIVDTRDRQQPFTDRLIRELAAQAPIAGPLRTIFIGGGTPTLLRVELWRPLLAALAEHFDLSQLEEWTVECNPETATPELFETLAAGGVDRLSIGAQSFNTDHLKTLERWHDPANVGRALKLADAAGIARRSIDLIYAIAGQTLGDFDDDLTRALDLGVTHLSCYNLTYEPNTAMTKRLELGRFEPTDEDLEVAMFERLDERLAPAGLRRYEVSNYAVEGEESRHNLAYWRQEQWLAAGPSASAHVAGARWKNVPRLDDYLADHTGEGYSAIIDHEPRHAARALMERLMTGLRLAEGVDAERVLADANAIHERLPAALRAKAERLQQTGRLEVTDRWRVTNSGWLFADGLASDLMAVIAEFAEANGTNEPS
ncbi:MAG: radical SAM family heme chaperone HemW [Planctomycetota bacterium]